jgi:hypothetical protein
VEVTGELYVLAARLTIDKRLPGSQSRCGRRGEKSLALSEIEPRSSSPQPVAILTELYHFPPHHRQNYKFDT